VTQHRFWTTHVSTFRMSMSNVLC